MARLLVEKLQFDAPEVRPTSKPVPKESDETTARARNLSGRVYVAAPQLAVAQKILEDACIEVGESIRGCTFERTGLMLYRLPAEWIDLNGDALSGFCEASAAPGLILRALPTKRASASLRLGPQASRWRQEDRLPLRSGTSGPSPSVQVQTAQAVDTRLLRRRGCNLLPHERAELRRLQGKALKERAAPLVRISVPSHAALAAFSDLVTLYNDEDRTVEKAALLPSGARIPCPLPDCECPLTAFCEETVKRVAAACSIQAAWRGVRGRARLPVSLRAQVLERRAAVCVQRYWRAFLLHGRCALLGQLREVAAQAAHDTLAMSLADHARMLRHSDVGIRSGLPEKNLRFVITSSGRVHLHRSALPFRKTPLPKWLGVTFPTVEAESSSAEKTKVEALLTEGVRQEGLSSVLGMSPMSSAAGPSGKIPGSPQGLAGPVVRGRPRFSARPEEWGFRGGTGTRAPFSSDFNGVTTFDDVTTERSDAINESHVAYLDGQLYDDLLQLPKATSALIGPLRLPMTSALSSPTGRVTPGAALPKTEEQQSPGVLRTGRSAGSPVFDVEKGKRMVKLLRFDGREEAQRRAVLLYALTYSLRDRCGVRLVSAAPPTTSSAHSVPPTTAYPAKSPLYTAATESETILEEPSNTGLNGTDDGRTEHWTVGEIADTLLSMSVDTLRAREWAAVYGLARRDLWVRGKGLHWLDLAMGRIEELLEEPGGSRKPDPKVRRLRLFGERTLTQPPEFSKDTIFEANGLRADALRTLKVRWDRERLWRAEMRATNAAALRASARALTGLLRTTRTGLLARPVVRAETDAEMLTRAARAWEREEEQKKRRAEESRLEAARLRTEMREKAARHAQAIARVTAKERIHLRAEAATCRQTKDSEDRAAATLRAARAEAARRKASARAFAIALGGQFQKMSNHLAAADFRLAREQLEKHNHEKAALVRRQENKPVEKRKTMKFTKCEG